MSNSSGNKLDTITKIIVDIELTPENVLHYEECEIIADLMEDAVINEVQDEELRTILRKMRSLHREVRMMNYPEYIRTATEIFQKIPRKEHVLKYHQTEELSKLFTEEEITRIQDERLKETLYSLKHVHDNISEKKANVIKRVNLY